LKYEESSDGECGRITLSGQLKMTMENGRYTVQYSTAWTWDMEESLHDAKMRNMDQQRGTEQGK